MGRLEGAIAATRFAMGARPGEIDLVSSDPRGWLKAQIGADAAVIPAGDLRSTRTVLDARREEVMARAAASGDSSMMPPNTADGAAAAQVQRQAIQRRANEEIRQGLVREAEARSQFSSTTANSFADRWARFWSNHLTVSGRGLQSAGLAGPYEREAIRAHAFGDFRTLLTSAALHPGMLVYLDAQRSVGPNSRAAGRREGAGLNENLAREVLELHTLGVKSGYSQDDVIEFAKALTGWTTAARPPGVQARRGGALVGVERFGDAVFVPDLHEPGPRRVLGRRYPEEGAGQAAAILGDLAASPATARHVALKLARHFVADQPPEAAIARLEKRFIETRGNLSELARAVVDLDAAWSPEPRKFKTPEELLVSAARGTGQDIAYGRDRRAVYEALGQPPYGAPSPAGWPDEAAHWAGSDALKKRLEWANTAANRNLRGTGSPLEFLEQALGPLADARTREAVTRAESAEQGFTLALMSPAFQRR